MEMTKMSEPITLEALLPLIQDLSEDEREQLRKHLETDSAIWKEKRETSSFAFAMPVRICPMRKRSAILTPY